MRREHKLSSGEARPPEREPGNMLQLQELFFFFLECFVRGDALLVFLVPDFLWVFFAL
jgi:hypothetical protein